MAWRGDLGYTDLLDQQDVPKHDLRIEVLGTLDEVSSALGIARAMTANESSASLILVIQRDLCWMMSELAATTEEARPGIHITAERVNWLSDTMADLETEAPLEPHFTVPGDSTSGGFVQLGRSIVRRAERLVTLLDQQGALHNAQIIAYLNRLSALLFVLARYEDLMAGVTSPTPARPPE
ncbi:MAG: cob(I)yrinic acid a,c-diamide adenosyltransferase [Anaerolineae bacterium]